MSKVRSLEIDRLTEQARLDTLKTAAERNKLGQFATPPVLALEIARYAREKLNGKHGLIRFLDPAIGTGAFYAATLDSFPAKRIGYAAGVEIDRAFAHTAAEIWGKTGLQVINGDFTRQPQPAELFNLILTNPPYVRHHHLKAEDKVRLCEIIRQQHGIKVSGLAGLYCYFLLLADGWLDKQGLAVWLIPSEFMDVNYGSAVKQYLTDKVTLLHIHRFCPSNVQFDDALVSSAVVVFRKATAPDGHEVEFSFGGSLADPAKSECVPLSSLRGHPKWTGFPDDGTATRQFNEPMLGDFFSIKRGLATGNNSFFILPRAKAIELGIPPDCFRPILPSPRHLTLPVVEADDDGYPKIEPQLVLIDCNYSEQEIRRLHPRFWKYLAAGKEKAVHSGYLTSRRVPWYSQERREVAPFLCTYMGRSRGTRKPFRVIWNLSHATAANVYLLLYPKPELKAAFDADPSLYRRVFAMLSEIEEIAFTRVEPAELARLPVGTLAKIVGVQTPKARQLVLFA